MLATFEKFTNELNDYERTVLLPLMVRCFERHVGEDTAITNREIVQKMQACGYEISDARTRKIVHTIRRDSLVPCLVASSKGYFVADKINQISDCIDSLQGRENAISVVKNALIAQREVMREQLTQQSDE
jgi:hypothetical protein